MRKQTLLHVSLIKLSSESQHVTVRSIFRTSDFKGLWSTRTFTKSYFSRLVLVKNNNCTCYKLILLKMTSSTNGISHID